MMEHFKILIWFNWFIVGTLGSLFCQPIHAECSAEIWSFVSAHGVEIVAASESKSEFVANLVKQKVPLLSHGPVRLHLQHFSFPGLQQLVELAMEVEAYSTIGQTRMAMPCASWQALVPTDSLQRAHHYLIELWLGRWRHWNNQQPQDQHEPYHSISILDSLWDTNP